MFGPSAEGNRGALIVVDVWEGASAQKAGVHLGDGIVEIDGKPVAGKDVEVAFREELHGPPGSTVRLTILRPSEGLRRFEVQLVRTAFPMRGNPSFEPFSYSALRSWRFESYEFPVSWSPKLPFHGIEDLLFAPRFDDREGPEYHSLAWIWWLEGAPRIDAAILQSTLLEYFRGLSVERGGNNHFEPDLSKVSTAEPSEAEPSEAGRSEAGGRRWKTDVVTYDTHAVLITLHVDVEARACADHTALLFALSPAPRDAAIWTDMSSILSTFRCNRELPTTPARSPG
jgi:hypothetical protein